MQMTWIETESGASGLRHAGSLFLLQSIKVSLSQLM